jgi:hypothetical protein
VYFSHGFRIRMIPDNIRNKIKFSRIVFFCWQKNNGWVVRDGRNVETQCIASLPCACAHRPIPAKRVITHSVAHPTRYNMDFCNHPPNQMVFRWFTFGEIFAKNLKNVCILSHPGSIVCHSWKANLWTQRTGGY